MADDKDIKTSEIEQIGSEASSSKLEMPADNLKQEATKTSNQNPSDKSTKKTNSTVDAIDESAALTELERIGARAGRPTEQMASLEQRIKSEGKTLNRLLEEGRKTPIISESPFFEEQKGELQESIKGIRTKMRSIERAKVLRAESEASTYISKQFPRTAGSAQVSDLTKDLNVQNRAFGMSTMPHGELQARQEDVMAQIRLTEREALGEVKGMFGKGGQVVPERSAAIGVMMTRTQEHLKELATISAAQQLQKTAGQDPITKMKNIQQAGQEAQKLLSVESIANEIKQGDVGIKKDGKETTISTQDINREIIAESERLVKALRDLSTTVDDGKGNLEGFRKTAEEATENLDKLKTAQGMGGGGGISGTQWMSAASGGFNAVGGALQQLLVGQRLGQVSNLTGFANIENQKYDMYKAARGGDVLSQMLLPQYGEAEKFGQELWAGQQAAQTAYTAGGVAQAAAGGFQMAEGATGKVVGIAGQVLGTGSLSTQAVLQGAQNTVQGLATTAVSAGDQIRQVSANAAAIQGTQADIEARKAMLRIPAEQMQGFRDFSMGMGAAAQGMGSRGARLLNSTVNQDISDLRMLQSRHGDPLTPTFMERMVNSRMSPEQMAQMTQAGVAQMGSMFNTEQVFAAKGLERSGLGSMDQNMQRMAQLAQVGSNNPQAGLGSVLEAAVTKGLDSSKSLDMMVQNTAQIVSQNATATAAGIDVTGAASTLLAAGADPNMQNKEFSIQRAATAKEAAQSIMSNTDVSFAGMVNTARISQTTGLSGDDAIYAAKLTTEELKTMQKELKAGNKEKVRDTLMGKGINPNTFKDGLEKGVDQLLDSSITTLAEGRGVSFASGNAKQVTNIANAMRTDDFSKLTDEEKTLMGKIGAQNQITGQELGRAGAAINAKNDEGASKKVGKLLAGEGGSEEFKKVYDMMTSGSKQAAEAALQATENFKSAADALKALSKMTANYEKFGAKGGEGQFASAASESAGTFADSTIKFEKAVDIFSSKIDDVIKKSGLSAASSDARVKQITDDFARKSQEMLDEKK